LTDLLILCVAALVAGAQNSLAGGGTLYTFPTLQGILGNDIQANGTSTVALLPGSIAGAWGFRREVRQTPGRILALLVGPSLVGGVIGTLLVVKLPGSVFSMMVPWLILTATLLFLFQPMIARLAGSHELSSRPKSHVVVGVVFFQFLVAIYGGYFGAGIGILMLSSLSMMGLGDIHRVNALKTVLAACINLMSLIVFVFDDKVVWKYALPMAIASIAGGYLGARLSRRMNKTLLRWVIIVIGFALAAYYFWKRYGGPLAA
jgi:uncharacterized membrane protein YfcA